MKKLSLLTLSLFVFSLMLAVTAYCGMSKCKVVSVDNPQITLDCGDDADEYEKGMDVKVKKATKRKQIEGC